MFEATAGSSVAAGEVFAVTMSAVIFKALVIKPAAASAASSGDAGKIVSVFFAASPRGSLSGMYNYGSGGIPAPATLTFSERSIAAVGEICCRLRGSIRSLCFAIRKSLSLYIARISF